MFVPKTGLINAVSIWPAGLNDPFLGKKGGRGTRNMMLTADNVHAVTRNRNIYEIY